MKKLIATVFSLVAAAAALFPAVSEAALTANHNETLLSLRHGVAAWNR